MPTRSAVVGGRVETCSSKACTAGVELAPAVAAKLRHRVLVQDRRAVRAVAGHRVDGLSLIALWVKHSHEHFDGTGYPDGLSGDDIPLASRILLVADAFDAMTSDRPYRSAILHEDAVAELRRNCGRQFDPRCVQAFEAYMSDSATELTAERVA